jgi:hypothetical protein
LHQLEELTDLADDPPRALCDNLGSLGRPREADLGLPPDEKVPQAVDDLWMGGEHLMERLPVEARAASTSRASRGRGCSSGTHPMAAAQRRRVASRCAPASCGARTSVRVGNGISMPLRANA